MGPLRRLWRALTRPRGRGRGRAGSRSGVAMLVVITTVMIMTVVVTDLAYSSRVRFVVSAHARDRNQAFWLARSGVLIYQLILTASKEIGSNEMLKEFGLGDSLWQMVPQINTGLMRMLLVGGDSGGDLEEEQLTDFAQTGQVDAAVAEQSRETGLFSDRNFLDFAGDFSADLEDQESRINVNALSQCSSTEAIADCATANLLYQLMSGDDEDQWFLERNIDRWEIIGNLKDWVDADGDRSGGRGGYEDALYNTQDEPYLAKNASFDSLEEIRLVDGWQGEVFDKYGDKLTVWGSGAKVNINSPSLAPETLRMLIKSLAETAPTDAELDQVIDDIELAMSVQDFDDGKAFCGYLENTYGWDMKDSCNDVLTNTSKTFRIASTGLVGDSALSITVVLDYSSKSSGKLLYWRVD
jgi:type II secretory pathway component PulK